MEDTKPYKLIIHNDNVNSFQYVMACLIGKCGHTPLQAEQCAIITHNVGKCHVKSGSFDEILRISDILDSLNLLTEIELDESYMY